MPREHVDHLKSLYEAFNQRDWDAVFGHLAEDFTWTFDPEGMLTGSYSGRAGIRDAVEGFVEVWDHFQVEMDECLVLDEEHVGVEGRVVGTGIGSGIPMELTETVVWTFRGDELIAGDEHLGAPAELRPRLAQRFGTRI